MNPPVLSKPPSSQYAPGSKLPKVLHQSSEATNFIDAKVASLKILAMTLLKEIESMENGAATQLSRDLNLHDEVHRFEAEMIKSALTKTGGRQRRAARLLGVKVTTLNTKIKRHKITVTEQSSDSVAIDPSRLVESQSEIIS